MVQNAERDEVYVLTLPAFVWFKANYTSVDPRIYHTCHVVGNQMLSIGGLNPSLVDFPVAMNDTDPFWEGIKVFDMTALDWTNYYNANSAPYIPSRAISDYYGGELKYPSWSLPAVEDLFVRQPSSNLSPTPSSSHEDGASNLNKTIGATVGGIGAFLVSVTCAIFLLVRRKRKNHRERERATGRLPIEHEIEQRQVAGGLYEADDTIQPAEAGPGEPRTRELDTGQPIPQEVEAVALSDLFELESPRRNNCNERTSNPLELGCHTVENGSGSVDDPSSLGSFIRGLIACSKDDLIELEALPK